MTATNGQVTLSIVGKPEETMALHQIWLEFVQANENWPGFNSLHEAHGVIAEEMDEFWAHVKVNQKRRDLAACRAELVQVAAMALKGVMCIDSGRGRV